MTMRPRLREILTEAITRERDMTLSSWSDRAETSVSARPDALVYEVADPFDSMLPARVLDALPASRVLLVSDSGEAAAVYELRPTRAVMHCIGIDAVIGAIRYGLGSAATEHMVKAELGGRL
jgi:hypothetical protein